MFRKFRGDVVELAVLDGIRDGMNLNGSIAIIGSRKDAEMVQWMINNEYVSEKGIVRAVHDSICQIGRKMFEWCRINPISNRPDHVPSAEALGYAMLYGVISRKEIELLCFDHDETPDEYIALAEGLSQKVVEQLRNGTAFFDLPKSSIGGTDDSHCCCC